MLRPATFYLLLMLPFMYIVFDNQGYLGGNGDIWNSLWTWDHISENCYNPFFTNSIHAPQGGIFVPSDLIGGYLYLIFQHVVSQMTFYTMYNLFCFWLFCFGTHLWVQQDGQDGYIAGCVVYSAASFRCIVQNGSTEMLTICWIPLLFYFWKQIHTEKKTMVYVCALMLLISIGSWYGAIMMFAMLCFVEPLQKTSPHKRMIWLGTCFCVVLWAMYIGNLVDASPILDIKQSTQEMNAIRRSYGVADIRSYFYVYPFLSPDFSLISQSNEVFFHSTYIGWIAIILCLIHGYQNIQSKSCFENQRSLMSVGVLFFSLSLGPVLVIDTQPIILFETYVLPAPYLLLENFWGFDHMTLLYRFSVVPTLVVGYYASRLFLHWKSDTQKKYVRLGIVACILLEGFVISPTKNIPSAISPPISDISIFEFDTLEQGNMILYPIGNIGTSLYEQQKHHMPLVSTLNKNTSKRGHMFWREVTYHKPQTCEDLLLLAKKHDIQYIWIDRRKVILPSKISHVIQNTLELCPTNTKTSTTHQLISLW